MVKKTYLRENRYIDYSNRTIDLLWKSEMLNILNNSGIEKGMTLVEIYDALNVGFSRGRPTTQSLTTQSRVSILYRENWLCKKIIKHRKATETQSEVKFVGREKYLYFLGYRARQYLSEFSGFDEGWLCRIPEKYKLRNLLSEREREKLQKEKESKKLQEIGNGINTHSHEKEFEIGEDTNLEYDNTRRESW